MESGLGEGVERAGGLVSMSAAIFQVGHSKPLLKCELLDVYIFLSFMHICIHVFIQQIIAEHIL